MMYLSRILAFCAAFFGLSTLLHAHEVRQGDLIIRNAIIPATIAVAPVAAGYLMIANNGSEAERLVSVSTGFSEKSQIHTMAMTDGVMKMRPLPDGLIIPAGETVLLKKGGNHLMFMKLQEQMQAGELRKVTLNFEKAGAIEIEMQVMDPAHLEKLMPKGAGSSHSGHTTTSN